MKKQELSFDEIFLSAIELSERDKISQSQALQNVFLETRFAKEIWLVFKGFCGSQIYLTVPLYKIGLAANVQQLLDILDKMAKNDPENSMLVCYSPLALEEDEPDILEEENYDRYSLSGRMGGASLLQKNVWLHKRLDDQGIGAQIRRLLDIADDVEIFVPDYSEF